MELKRKKSVGEDRSLRFIVRSVNLDNFRTMSSDDYILFFYPKAKQNIYITGNKIIILGPKYTNTFIELKSKFNPALSSAIPIITPTIQTKYNNDNNMAFTIDFPILLLSK